MFENLELIVELLAGGTVTFVFIVLGIKALGVLMREKKRWEQ